jgi:hypothetical protein
MNGVTKILVIYSAIICASFLTGCGKSPKTAEEYRDYFSTHKQEAHDTWHSDLCHSSAGNRTEQELTKCMSAFLFVDSTGQYGN